MTPLAEAQTMVQQLIAEHGSCSPLELLLATNRLDYDDYRAWRRGERDTLDDTLVDGPGWARALMEHVQDWALLLNLEAQPIALYGIEENAGTELRASTDSRLDEFLHTAFQPAASRSQLDLFLDNQESAAANQVIAALESHDTKAAGSLLARLVEVNPHHWAIADVNTLIEALQAKPPGAHEARERLAVLEGRWQPAASAVLHGGARDFLTPMWRQLGTALEGEPFNPRHPHHHAAWAHFNGLDWAGVQRNVCGIADYERQPLLLGWLAEAQWRLRDRKGALATWFALCWHEPDHFKALIEGGRFPDAALTSAWRAAMGADVEPPITAPWFPAWVVLTEPGVALGIGASGGGTDPCRAFDALIALAAGGNDRQEMKSRRTLQALHADLFNLYLDTVDA